MKTLEELRAGMQKSLLELETLEQNPWTQTKHALEEKYMLREKMIGKQCYEAEEMLSEDELVHLKLTLHIDKRQWQRYKARFIHHPPERVGRYKSMSLSLPFLPLYLRWGTRLPYS
jgi:hypothetical protein